MFLGSVRLNTACKILRCLLLFELGWKLVICLFLILKAKYLLVFAKYRNSPMHFFVKNRLEVALAIAIVTFGLVG